MLSRWKSGATSDGQLRVALRVVVLRRRLGGAAVAGYAASASFAASAWARWPVGSWMSSSTSSAVMRRSSCGAVSALCQVQAERKGRQAMPFSVRRCKGVPRPHQGSARTRRRRRAQPQVPRGHGGPWLECARGRAWRRPPRRRAAQRRSRQRCASGVAAGAEGYGAPATSSAVEQQGGRCDAGQRCESVHMRTSRSRAATAPGPWCATARTGAPPRPPGSRRPAAGTAPT